MGLFGRKRINVNRWRLVCCICKKYKLEGESEFDAQWAALESIKENADINFKEVSAYE